MLMISVIGGGPAGLYTAFRLAKAGKSVTVYEEHKTIGEPVQCTGIVTRELEKLVPIKKFLVNMLKYAKIRSRKRVLKLPVSDLVIDRSKFDQYLAEKAEDAGANIITGQKLTKIPSGIVIGADGPDSLIRKELNPKIRTEYYVGKQAVVKGNFAPDTFSVKLGSAAPGFFSWTVPINDNLARIGVAAKGNPDQYFQKLTKNKKIESIQAGIIPIYQKLKVHRGSMYLVGDAAAFVKATTGGGLVPGLQAARILTDCIIHRKSYEKNLKNIRKELSFHKFIRNTLDKFSDNDFDNLLSILNRDNLKPVFSTISRDNSVSLVMNLLIRQPRLISYARKII